MNNVIFIFGRKRNEENATLETRRGRREREREKEREKQRKILPKSTANTLLTDVDISFRVFTSQV